MYPPQLFPPLHSCCTNPSCDTWHFYNEEKLITAFCLDFAPSHRSLLGSWCYIIRDLLTLWTEVSFLSALQVSLSLNAWIWEVLKAEWWWGDTVSYRHWLQGHAGSRGFKTRFLFEHVLKDSFENCWALHLSGPRFSGWTRTENQADSFLTVPISLLGLKCLWGVIPYL